ncbi:methylmalonyl-CoA mutase family protein [Streptomyces sp. CB01881]|uniref:methylmalonyl-CoA mutase family protein n=1 Tax=Streptomyces sp. CB01881 TaxID=2078691 RepID=UPI000CDC6E39|nr:methylmalonyl-CoA mutase family protein [Streptomyces sp. CB01881]AUY52959.1 methylmalonyl-CoA mutase [Streptomyces sp. CB01881]TYC70675.1 methylmalonyl-CoA mutase [Streptomyces sp. CB01881]
MKVPPEGLPLAAEFPAAHREQWQQLVEGVLRKSGAQPEDGAAAEQALTTGLQDGLRARPLYTAEDTAAEPGYPGFPPFVRGGRPQGSSVAGWDVRQRHADPDPRRANEAVLADLENGGSSLWLELGGDRLPVAALPQALTSVYLDLAGVVLDAGAEFAEAAEQLFKLYQEREVSPGAAAGNLGADPLGLAARTGDAGRTDALLTDATALAARCAVGYPGLRALTVDALPYHEAGASPAQELGCSLATGVAYLRALTGAGLSVDAALGQLEFRYAADADQFLTIAKFRAARRLWARVAEVSGAAPDASAQRQHAVTSAVMMTARDPWVNMLRTTVACLAAGVGGADAVSVQPFDSALGLSDAFARRIARNTQSVLLEESHLARVVDPAGGSWYVEQLTDELAHAAWAWFQEIERAGGQAAALASGLVGERIAATWAERSVRLAKRREPVTGVSEFPNLDEQPLVREPGPAGPGGGLPRVRRAEAYEALRDRSDAVLEATGARPRLFLASIGSAAAHTARTTFAANLFQAGGIATTAVESTDPAAFAEAFAASGARVACLCSSDPLYGEHAGAVTAALKAAGARRVLLAGRPGEQQEAYEAAGVDEFVFAGGDAVATLGGLLDEITGASPDESGVA